VEAPRTEKDPPRRPGCRRDHHSGRTQSESVQARAQGGKDRAGSACGTANSSTESNTCATVSTGGAFGSKTANDRESNGCRSSCYGRSCTACSACSAYSTCAGEAGSPGKTRTACGACCTGPGQATSPGKAGTTGSACCADPGQATSPGKTCTAVSTCSVCCNTSCSTHGTCCADRIRKASSAGNAWSPGNTG